MQQHNCKHELTSDMNECTRLAQDQANQNFSVDSGGPHEVLPLAGELLKLMAAGARIVSFLQGVWLLRSYSYSSRLS